MTTKRELSSAEFDRLAAVLAEPVAVDAWDARPSTTGAEGWDVDVEYGDLVGEVTLLPRECGGQPARWGSADNWVSGGLLEELRRLPREEYLGALDRLEEAARKEIEAAGVEPAVRDEEEA